MELFDKHGNDLNKEYEMSADGQYRKGYLVEVCQE